MNDLFERKEIDGISYNIIVSTKFGQTLCTASGDNIFHTTPILKKGLENLNSFRINISKSKIKLSNKRRI